MPLRRAKGRPASHSITRARWASGSRWHGDVPLQGLGGRLGPLGCRAASVRSASAWWGGGAAPSGSGAASRAKQPLQRVQRGVGVTCNAPHLRQGGKQHAALPGGTLRATGLLLAGRASRQRALRQPRPQGAHQSPTTGQHTRLHTRDRRCEQEDSRDASMTKQARCGRSTQRA